MSRKRTSLSLSPDDLSKAKARYKALGYESVSECIEALVLQDADQKRKHVVERVEGGVRHSSESSAAETAESTHPSIESVIFIDGEDPVEAEAEVD